MNITPESALRLGMSLKEACAAVWLSQAAADVLDHPKAVAMGTDALADWLRGSDDDAATKGA